MKLPRIVDPCMCALRHLTVRHAEYLRVNEQLRACNGMAILASVIQIVPRSWGVIKALLGVVRNLAANQMNIECMRAFNMISHLMMILYDTVNLIQSKVDFKLILLIDKNMK